MRRTFFTVAACCVLFVSAVQAQDEREPAPVMKDLGGGRYLIGTILLDTEKQEFSVPGKVIHLDDALEYIAVTRGGMKEYESLLELDSGAREFKLACILIGLDENNSVKPRYQFDALQVKGQAVSITISWQDGDETRSVSAANALSLGEETYDNDNWVYIGSMTTDGNRQLTAELSGTLIGFVHDPDSIIEHRDGAGIGAYGMVTGNNELLPPEGAPVTVSVSVVK